AGVELAQRRTGVQRLFSSYAAQALFPLGQGKGELILPALVAKEICPKGLALDKHRVASIDLGYALEAYGPRIVALPFPTGRRVDDSHAGNIDLLGDGCIPATPEPLAGGMLQQHMRITFRHAKHPESRTLGDDIIYDRFTQCS